MFDEHGVQQSHHDVVCNTSNKHLNLTYMPHSAHGTHLHPLEFMTFPDA